MRSESFVALVHLLYGDREGSCSLSRIGDDRGHHVRDTVVITELYNLRVDHDQLEFGRPSLIKEAGDDRVDAYRFTGTCSTGYQKMRHILEICHYVVSGNILTNYEFDDRRSIHELLGIDKVSYEDWSRLVVFDLDTYRCLARDRCLHTYALGSEVKSYIIGEPGDACDLDSCRRLDFISGDRCALSDSEHLGIYAEVVQSLFKELCSFFKLSIVHQLF